MKAAFFFPSLPSTNCLLLGAFVASWAPWAEDEGFSVSNSSCTGPDDQGISTKDQATKIKLIKLKSLPKDL